MFKNIKKQIHEKAAGFSNSTLFQVTVDRDLIWSIYLDNLPEDIRQEHTCNCCKSFLRQYGGIVTVQSDGTRQSLWDITDVPAVYADAIRALRRYIHTLPITGRFFAERINCGTDSNHDAKRGVVWSHFHIRVPNQCVFPADRIGPLSSCATADKEVLERSLLEITENAVQTVLELIGQNSLYRGNEHLANVSRFAETQRIFRDVAGHLKPDWCWQASASLPATICRIRNTAIGTLLVDLSEGKDLDVAVSAFERMVAPTNYKRPTALVTPRMVAAAETRLDELGLKGSLNRRILSGTDLTANNTLFSYRPTKVAGTSVFDEIKQGSLVNPKSLTKVEEISIDDFITGVLPTAKSIRALLENHHLGNLVTLVGPQDPEDPTLFNFSWSYTGEVADSIKERVKQAGGKVDGYIRISLSWGNFDDLDLHLQEPGGAHVFYGSKRGRSGATLDVDMNAGGGHTRTPVENIFWKNPPAMEGDYVVFVHQFVRREASNTGFDVELEFDGEVYEVSAPDNGRTNTNHTAFAFNYTRAKGVVVKGQSTPKAGSYRSQEKWGLSTGQFHHVRAITLSPNHWSGAVGNKHFFFLLEGCKSDQKTRGFYNEFLKEELSADRKVFEILGSKVQVEPTEDELSGIGFSETVRNSLFVEVEGAFKRMLKIKF
jgi:hypothetical protein